MDYKRIQMILIVTFSVLNLYLLTILLEKNDALNLGNPGSTVNLEEGLRNESIDTRTLSSEQEMIPVIKADKNDFLEAQAASLKKQVARMENNILLSVLSEPIKLDFDTQALTLSERTAPLQAFIDDGYVLRGSDYELFSYQPSNRRIIYVQKTDDNIAIADGTSSLIFYLNDQDQVTSYEQTYAGIIEVQGRPRTVISEQSAIETLYLNNQIPSNSSIQLLTLAYYQTLSLSDMNIYSPMWYVEITRDNLPVITKWVDALTGSVIKAPIVIEEAEVEEEAKINTSRDKASLIMGNN